MAKRKKNNKWTDYERLQLFTDDSEALSKTRLLSHEKLDFGCQVAVSIFGTTVKQRGIDEDDLRAFLLGLRPFLSEEEPVFLHGIYNICDKLIPDAQVISYIRKSRSQWKRERNDEMLKFIFNKKRIHSEEIVNWWMNSSYFHRDRDKRQIMTGLPEAVRAITRYDFLCYVLQAASHVIWVGMNVRYAFNNNLVGVLLTNDGKFRN